MAELWVALDLPHARRAKAMASQLLGFVDVYKVGLQLYTSSGPAFVRALVDSGARVFLDLKFHDIPNTVAGAAGAAARIGVSHFDVHAAGGKAMMQAAVAAAGEEAAKVGRWPRPKVIAITVLTSIDEQIARSELGLGRSIREQALRYAAAARESGLDGVVASVQEASAIRAECGPEFLIVTPGIRPSFETKPDDQRRVGTPAAALRAGSSAIVVGRPIIASADPVDSARRIRAELARAETP